VTSADAARPGPESGVEEADRPLRRDAERNRQRILEAARDLFALRGLDVTMDDIAHHAGLGIGTVYRRYPSREHLVEALFDTRLDELVGAAEAGLRHPDPWTGLKQFAEQATENLAADRGLQDVLFSRTYGRDRVARTRERIAPLVDELLARCRDARVIRNDVTGTDVALVQFMLAAVIEYTENVEPGLWRRYLTLILDGLRGQTSTLPVPPPEMDTLTEIADRWRPPRRPAIETP
jgi:AcrR family transcriptional regulator